jgi:RHS repeat-associated protein
VVSEVRYLPYGEERWTNGATPTDFTFTGQRNEAGFGLMDYNARYYSARLGRFVSPDTIIPEPINSQGFNRYSYANNNPLKYTDPSGHQGCDEQVEDCDDSDQDKELLDQKDEKIEDNLDASSPPISDEDLAKFLSAVGFGLDVTGLGINFLGAAVTDIAFGGLGPVGYAAGVSAHNAVLTGPTLVVDGIGVGFVAAAGFVTGENQIGFDNGTLTLTLNQDTIVAAGGFVAGGINPEPNVDVLISGGAVAYDYGRFPFEQHEPFYTYPTHFDSVTIQAGMRNSFSVQYLNCAPETGH